MTQPKPELFDVAGRPVPEQIEFTCMIAEGFIRLYGDDEIVAASIEAARAAARLYNAEGDPYLEWLDSVRRLDEDHRPLVALMAPDEWGPGKEDVIPRLVRSVLPERTAARIYREWAAR